MTDVKSIGFALDPANTPSFLLDWELTKLCNLDCSYCPSGIDGGHDNSTAHPPLEECLRTIDFMYKYVDLYMQYKSKWSRNVVLNVYGGESLFHPDIVQIYELINEKYQKYKDRWTLTTNTTTNLIAGPTVINRVLPYVQYWTVSYHTESNEKQKQQFKNNLLHLKESNANVKVTVLMNPHLWEDALSMIDFCKQNQINFLPRQLDQLEGSERYNYDSEQINWFNQFYQTNTYKTESYEIEPEDNKDLSQVGRACCGGRQLCLNQNYKQREFYIPNQFTGWSCSVNWFFLYIKQVTGDVYNNKDCRMRFDNTEGPIGNLANSQLLIDNLKEMLSNNMSIIQCAKKSCWCGLCAPKAENQDDFKKLIGKYLSTNPFLA